MKTKLALALICLVLVPHVRAEDKPSLSLIDRTRLAEAFRLGETIGNRIWPDWDKAPFAVLLVTPQHEFLIRHPKPSKDFAPLGRDAILQSDVYFRKRQFSPNLLATFPAVGGVSTIVIGQAENTDAKTSTSWVVTLMHEHFHQLQDSQPNAYADLEALNLSRGDSSGMWMLNYAFPYESPEIKQQFLLLTKYLGEALRATESEFSTKLESYLAARRQLRKLLNDDDYKYLSMQLWKEGIARYTEYRVAQVAARSFRPGKAFRALNDFKSFDSVARKIMSGVLYELDSLKLEDYKRVAFYPIGAGEGLLLDKIKANWKGRYFREKFYVDKYFNASHNGLKLGLP